MKIKRLIICMLALIAPMAAWADGAVSFTGQAQPNVVTAGNRFRVVYTLENGQSSEFREGECEGLSKVFGPSTSKQSSVQIINGSIEKSESMSFTMMYNAPKAGEYTISPATVVYKGTKYTSNAVKVTVVDGGQAASAQGTSDGQASATQSNGAVADLMIRQTVNKESVWEGEAIVLTTKIYTRVNLSEISGITPPQLAEFVSQELFEGQLNFGREVVGGVVYNSAVSSQKVLIPQKNGKIKIDPIEYDFVVKERVRGSGGGFFGDFFDDVQLTRRKVKSNALTVNVKPLPEGKPAGFSGGVGDFKMAVSVNPDEVEADNSVQVKVTVSGEGNLKLLTLPRPVFHQDFDAFDPSETQKIQNTHLGTKGQRTAEYLIIPRVAGEFEIPEVKFSYFNTLKGKYETLTQGPFKLSVKKGSGSSSTGGMVVSPTQGSAVVYTGKDLRYIKVADTELKRKGEFFVMSGLFWAVCGGLVALFVGAMMYLASQRKNSREADRVRMKRANKAARKRLKVAAKLMKEQKREAFFDEVMRALWGYLSDKLTLPLSELTKDNAKEQMQQHNIEPATADEFMKLLDDCEFARYAPANMVRPMEEIFRTAEEVIGKIDGYIK